MMLWIPEMTITLRINSWREEYLQYILYGSGLGFRDCDLWRKKKTHLLRRALRKGGCRRILQNAEVLWADIGRCWHRTVYPTILPRRHNISVKPNLLFADPFPALLSTLWAMLSGVYWSTSQTKAQRPSINLLPEGCCQWEAGQNI